ncbi:hypothetical protein DFH09DRAFT_1165793 [Mycena vulgaris]|nr:hypothetical protein DFH09DRAFT_1165793 [Mycena vulgaris]
MPRSQRAAACLALALTDAMECKPRPAEFRRRSLAHPTSLSTLHSTPLPTHTPGMQTPLRPNFDADCSPTSLFLSPRTLPTHYSLLSPRTTLLPTHSPHAHFTYTRPQKILAYHAGSARHHARAGARDSLALRGNFQSPPIQLQFCKGRD